MFNHETWTDKVRAFQKAMGQPLDREWAFDKMEAFRTELVEEEYMEFSDASTPEDILKELCDLIYVAIGYAVTYGWDIETAFNRVHQSNMSKLVDGKPVLREDGKILKGPNYQPPQVRDCLLGVA